VHHAAGGLALEPGARNAHLCGVDLLGGVQKARHVVVDGLVDGLALLEGLDLVVHQVKVLGLGVQGGDAGLAAALAVEAVVVVQADDGGHVGDEGVAVGVAACWGVGGGVGGGCGQGAVSGDRGRREQAQQARQESDGSGGKRPFAKTGKAGHTPRQQPTPPLTSRGHGGGAEDGGHAAHEGGLAAACGWRVIKRAWGEGRVL
jgi:hypothetical protein